MSGEKKNSVTRRANLFEPKTGGSSVLVMAMVLVLVMVMVLVMVLVMVMVMVMMLVLEYKCRKTMQMKNRR